MADGNGPTRSDGAASCADANAAPMTTIAMMTAERVSSSGGLSDRKARYSSRSYAIFSVPAMKNGTLINDGRENRRPANNGLSAAPVVRATPAMPDAADRSSGGTTAMV
jgi:hypothetical protein